MGNKILKKDSLFFINEGFGSFSINERRGFHCLSHFMDWSHFPFVNFLNPFLNEQILFRIPNNLPIKTRSNIFQRNILSNQFHSKLKQY